MKNTDKHKKQQDDKEKQDESIVALKQKLEECESKYKRALADYQNLEKRIRDERGEFLRFANRELLLRFLPVLDTLLLAKQHSEDEALTVCVNQFFDTLKSEGVVRVATAQEHFDPLTMEVINTSQGEEGVVIQEVRAGYLLNDKLLRPAQVVVGKKTNS